MKHDWNIITLKCLKNIIRKSLQCYYPCPTREVLFFDMTFSPGDN